MLSLCVICTALTPLHLCLQMVSRKKQPRNSNKTSSRSLNLTLASICVVISLNITVLWIAQIYWTHLLMTSLLLNPINSPPAPNIHISLQQRHKQHTPCNRTNITTLRHLILFCLLHISRIHLIFIIIALFPLPLLSYATQHAPHSS